MLTHIYLADDTHLSCYIKSLLQKPSALEHTMERRLSSCVLQQKDFAIHCQSANIARI